MGFKATPTFFTFFIFSTMALPPLQACGYCTPLAPKVSPPSHKPPKPPVIVPPIIVTPPATNPPVIIPPPRSTYPPYNPPGGGVTPPGCGSREFIPPPTTPPTCRINALKLGACVDLLSGLVDVGIGNPIENACCPLIKGLLEFEAAICLCTTIRLKLLNLNIILPIALQALITCGKNLPPGFVCPSLS